MEGKMDIDLTDCCFSTGWLGAAIFRITDLKICTFVAVVANDSRPRKMSYVVGVKTNRKILFFQNFLASETEIQISRTVYRNENFFMKILFSSSSRTNAKSCNVDSFILQMLSMD